MAYYVIACAIVLFLSYASGFSAKKLGITFILMICGVFVVIQAMDSIIERFETETEKSGQMRVVPAQATAKMSNDKLFGIGLNNFSHKINSPYPYGEHIYPELHEGKLPPADYEESTALVETIYMMIAAETGWHNLIVFFIFIFYFYFKNLLNYKSYKNSAYRFVTIGFAGGLLGICFESSLEWVLKQTNNSYQHMLVFALIGVMSKIYKKNNIRLVRKKDDDSK